MAARFNFADLSETPSPDENNMDYFRYAAENLSDALTAARIAHAFMGGFALFLLGNQRIPADIDIVTDARLVPDVWDVLDKPNSGFTLPSSRHHDGILKVFFVVSGVRVGIDIWHTDRAFHGGARLPATIDVRCRDRSIPVLGYAQLVNSKLAAWDDRRSSKDARDIYFLVRRKGERVKKRHLNQTWINNFLSERPHGLSTDQFKQMKKALKGKSEHCVIL